MLLLSGSIVFYWVDSAPPAQVAEKAHRLGVRSLAVKAGDSGILWPQYRALSPYLDSFGIERPAWAYVRPTTLEGDVQVAEAVKEAGAGAYIADMESPYLGEPEAARLFGRLLRSRLGSDYPIYVTTFSGPGAKPSFPWEEVASWADGLMPEWYAGAYPGGSTEAEAQSAYSALTPFGKPILPVGPIYGTATEADVKVLMRFAQKYDLPALLWWRWGSSSDSLVRLAASVDLATGKSGRPDPHESRSPVRSTPAESGRITTEAEATLMKRLDALERRMRAVEQTLGLISKDLRAEASAESQEARAAASTLRDLGASEKGGRP